jgi:5'-nucleotidase
MVFHKHNLPRLSASPSGILLDVTQPSGLNSQDFPNWSQIDDVLLDMDGTLLDRHFDNFFFEEELPRRYAALHNLSFEESRDRLMAMYRSVEGELAWTDLNYWTSQVGIDVVAMHRELDHMIGFLPGAEEFLRHLQQLGKRVTIVTNAHSTGVSVKVAKTGLDRYVDRIVDAFEVGYLKMRPEYWPNCQRLLGFEPSRSLFMDDDEGCLTAAKEFGVAHLVHSAKSSSQLPPQPSAQFSSIDTFQTLLNGL